MDFFEFREVADLEDEKNCAAVLRMTKVGSTSLLYLEVLMDFFEFREVADLEDEKNCAAVLRIRRSASPPFSISKS